MNQFDIMMRERDRAREINASLLETLKDVRMELVLLAGFAEKWADPIAKIVKPINAAIERATS